MCADIGSTLSREHGQVPAACVNQKATPQRSCAAVPRRLRVDDAGGEGRLTGHWLVPWEGADDFVLLRLLPYVLAVRPLVHLRGASPLASAACRQAGRRRFREARGWAPAAQQHQSPTFDVTGSGGHCDKQQAWGRGQLEAAHLPILPIAVAQRTLQRHMIAITGKSSPPPSFPAPQAASRLPHILATAKQAAATRSRSTHADLTMSPMVWLVIRQEPPA